MPEGIEIVQSCETCNRRKILSALNRHNECMSIEQISDENDNNAVRKMSVEMKATM